MSATTATASLEALVDRIEANPGRLIDREEFDALSERVDLRLQRPAALASADLSQGLLLIYLTECAAGLGARAMVAAAEAYAAPWLRRWTERVWYPDELSHAAPYRRMLLTLGFSESDLDARAVGVAERDFDFPVADAAPVQVTAYGMVQEYLTDAWHGRMGALLRPVAPEAATMALRVKQRERLHTIWCRDMTALQLEHDAQLLTDVADVLGRFRMPGSDVAPEAYAGSDRLAGALGIDAELVARELIRLLHSVAGDASRLGRLVVGVAAGRGMSLGSLSPQTVDAAMRLLGRPGAGLVGEVLLERVGLGYLYRDPTPSPARRVRALLRRWLASRVDIDLFPSDGGS